jgi:hypothetical protein
MSSLRLALKQSLAESAQMQLQQDIERRRMEESQRRKRRLKKKQQQQLKEMEMSDNNSASCVTDNVANDDSAASSSSQLRLSWSDQECEMHFDSDDDDVEGQQGDHIIRLKAKPRRKKVGRKVVEDTSSTFDTSSSATKLKKRKRFPPTTVAKPTPRVLSWVRGISGNKQQRLITVGLRVKVRHSYSIIIFLYGFFFFRDSRLTRVGSTFKKILKNRSSLIREKKRRTVKNDCDGTEV